MIKGGYILQPRKIDESEIVNCPPHVREIWHYLLRKANHADKIHKGNTIKRGQLLTSYKQIINDLSWYVGYRKESYKKHHCEIAMKVLTKEQMITTTKTTRGMILTVCNYDYYQNPNNYENDSDSYNKATAKLQSNDTINKNEKNVKNDNIKLHSENFLNFQQVVSYFDSKFFIKDKWLDCYDKLIRIEKYSENDILNIVKEFRSDGNWWKDSGNFESLLKLRKKNKDGIKYIDLFKTKLKKSESYEFAESDFS